MIILATEGTESTKDSGLWQIQANFPRLSADTTNIEKNRPFSLLGPLCDLSVLCG